MLSGSFHLHIEGLFTVEERDPHGESVFARAEQASQFDHHSRRRTAVIGADKIRQALGVVVGEKEQSVGRRSGDFDHDVSHLHVAERRWSMEGFRIDGTAHALELADEVILSAMVSIGPGCARTDGHEIGDVLKGLLPIEAAGLLWRGVRRGRRLLRLSRRFRRRRGCARRLGCDRAFASTGGKKRGGRK